MSANEGKREKFRRSVMEMVDYNRPLSCSECGGIMIFKGVGEYECEDCGHLDYDDYGKARNYIEKHPGATSAEVSEETGVTQRAIRDMLKESRLAIAPNSNAYLKCESCGTSIRYGRFCPKCEVNYHRGIEDEMRSERRAKYSGFSLERPAAEEGSKRFTREK